MSGLFGADPATFHLFYCFFASTWCDRIQTSSTFDFSLFAATCIADTRASPTTPMSPIAWHQNVHFWWKRTIILIVSSMPKHAHFHSLLHTHTRTHKILDRVQKITCWPFSCACHRLSGLLARMASDNRETESKSNCRLLAIRTWLACRRRFQSTLLQYYYYPCWELKQWMPSTPAPAT